MKRDNHYLAQSYLKPWADLDNKIWYYRLLVSHENVPIWDKGYCKGSGLQKDLYTRVLSGQESDEIESWFNEFVENPASEPIRKAISGATLKPEDWYCLVQYLAMQDRRTPKRLLEHLKFTKENIVEQMNQTLGETKEKLESGQLNRESFPANMLPVNTFPIKVIQEPSDEPGYTRIKVESIPGRASWLHSLQHQITKTAKVLHQYRWTIMQPATDILLPTSDCPVIKLNYHSKGKYDFGGGWASKGTEIFLPLSPEHILYTQVGVKRPPPRGTKLNMKVSLMIRKFIIEAAHRTIFSVEPEKVIAKIRPRLVDSIKFQEEQKQWQDWHKVQSEVEKEFL